MSEPSEFITATQAIFWKMEGRPSTEAELKARFEQSAANAPEARGEVRVSPKLALYEHAASQMIDAARAGRIDLLSAGRIVPRELLSCQVHLMIGDWLFFSDPHEADRADPEQGEWRNIKVSRQQFHDWMDDARPGKPPPRGKDGTDDRYLAEICALVHKGLTFPKATDSVMKAHEPFPLEGAQRASVQTRLEKKARKRLKTS